MNSPMRIVTAPSITSVSSPPHSQILEFLQPYPTYIEDREDWPPLVCNIANRTVEIHKPIGSVKHYEPDGRIGNEKLEGFGCAIQVCVTPEAGRHQLLHSDVWPTIESLLAWIRVRARHFWLLHGAYGHGARYRGSEFHRVGDRIQQTNFGQYSPAVIVRPLSKTIWAAIEKELKSGKSPPVSESIFCDALLSISAGDEMKGALELGVACEVEVTSLLDEVAHRHPDRQDAVEYLARNAKRNFPGFASKLKHWTVRCGLPGPEKYSSGSVPGDWIDTVQELYNLRNAIAHSGKLSEGNHRLPKYVVATNALFRYCRKVRIADELGGKPEFPENEAPEQIVALLGSDPNPPSVA